MLRPTVFLRSPFVRSSSDTSERTGAKYWDLDGKLTPRDENLMQIELDADTLDAPPLVGIVTALDASGRLLAAGVDERCRVHLAR